MLTLELLRDGSSCAASSARSEADCFSVLEERRDDIGIKRWCFLGRSAGSALFEEAEVWAAEEETG